MISLVVTAAAHFVAYIRNFVSAVLNYARSRFGRSVKRYFIVGSTEVN